MNWGWVRAAAAGLGMVLLLAALPLVFSKQVYAMVFTPKVILLYLGVAALVVALAAAGLERGGIEVRLTVVEVLALALLGWGLVSALFAVSRVTGFFGLLNWGTAWLFWLGCLVIWAAVRRLDFSEWGRLVALGMGFAVASFMGLLALLQVLGVESVVEWLPKMIGDRPGATVGNPIYFGAYMAVMLAVGVELSLRVRHGAWVAVTSAGLMLVTFGLVGNLSRGAWVGAVVGVVVLAAVHARDRAVRGRLLVPLVVVVVAAGVFAWQLPNLSGAALNVGARVEGTAPGVAAATGEPNTIATRIELWKISAAAALDRPVLGWGPGNFVTAGRQHMTPKLTGAEQARFADAHNLYAEFGATWGLPGLALLLAWLGAVIAQLWRAERQRARTDAGPRSATQASASSGSAAVLSTSDKGGRGTKGSRTGASGTGAAKATAGGRVGKPAAKPRSATSRPGAGGRTSKRGTPKAVGWAPLGLATLGTFLASSLSTPQHVVVAPTVMVVLGLSLSWRQAAALPGTRVLSLLSNRSRPAAIVGLAASIVLLGLVVVAGSHLLRGDARYADGITAATGAQSIEAFQAAAEADPWIERYWIALGDTQGILAALTRDAVLGQTAAENLRRGLALSPRDLEGLLSLSRVQLALGDPPGAMESAEQAVAYAPDDPRAHASLARALAVQGDRDRALAELDRALVGIPDVRVLILAGLAYRDLGDKVKAIQLLQQVQAAGYDDPLAAQALDELSAGG